MTEKGESQIEWGERERGERGIVRKKEREREKD